MKKLRLALALLPMLMVSTPSPAQSDCHSVGEQVAAEMGGQLARAVPGERDGKNVCIVVVLQAGQAGERPRRTEVVVPRD
jgi:hypothetical protein